MNQREEQILVDLAQRYAPQLLPMWDRSGTLDERLPRLARGLASYNILVIMADQPYSLLTIGQNVGGLIYDWANGYMQFYKCLCGDLFPSFTQITAHPTDDRWPIMIYIRGVATPVIQRMAGFVAPYVVHRQFDTQVSDAELIGLVDMILDELEAGNLSRDAYKRLREEAVTILKQMLNSPVQQLPLTEFDRAIFSDSQRLVPVKLENLPPVTSPPPPPTLPETGRIQPPRQADTQQLMSTEVMPAPPKLEPPDDWEDSRRLLSPNIMFGAKKEDEKKRRPPVPPLPNKNK
ncbi:MAG: hypothetical protein R3E39_06755 [Anaerolineae bacterium]